jgi:hypothetical protein
LTELLDQAAEDQFATLSINSSGPPSRAQSIYRDGGSLSVEPNSNNPLALFGQLQQQSAIIGNQQQLSQTTVFQHATNSIGTHGLLHLPAQQQSLSIFPPNGAAGLATLLENGLSTTTNVPSDKQQEDEPQRPFPPLKMSCPSMADMK